MSVNIDQLMPKLGIHFVFPLDADVDQSGKVSLNVLGTLQENTKVVQDAPLVPPRKQVTKHSGYGTTMVFSANPYHEQVGGCTSVCNHSNSVHMFGQTIGVIKETWKVLECEEVLGCRPQAMIPTDV